MKFKTKNLIVDIDPTNYSLGNIHFTEENYRSSCFITRESFDLLFEPIEEEKQETFECHACRNEFAVSLLEITGTSFCKKCFETLKTIEIDRGVVMKLSDAFKLLEDGEILKDSGMNFYIKMEDDLVLSSKDGNKWDNCDMNSINPNYLIIYKKPKEKVQRYIAMVKQGECDPFYYSSYLFTSKEDFESANTGFELIQLVKFGDPT